MSGAGLKEVRHASSPTGDTQLLYGVDELLGPLVTQRQKNETDPLPTYNGGQLDFSSRR